MRSLGRLTLTGIAGLAFAQEPSTFRVNTRLVEVDVVVRAGGQAVTGLTRSDFRILDNGKPQAIATFGVRSSSSKGAPAAPLPPGTISNRVSRTGQEPVSATVLLVDRLNTEVADQAYFGQQLIRYLKTMQPGEQVAVYSLLKTLHVVQDFTDDPRKVLAAASNARPQQSVSLAGSDESALKTEEQSLRNLADPNDAAGVAAMALTAEMATNALSETEDAEKKNRALLTAAALEDIARHLRGLPGRKKLVWISGGFPIGGLEGNSRHDDEFGLETARSVRALNNANVAVYAIDPRGLVAYGANPTIQPPNTVTGQSIFSQVARPDPIGLNAPNIAAMNLFASGTGGRAIYGTNDLAGALKTVMEDDEIVYSLGFYPADQKMDGSYHKLSVKVARRGVEVHYRQGYLASDTKVFSVKQRRDALSDAVQNPLDSTELGLRASTVRVPGRTGVYRLAVTLNINELHLEHLRNRWIALIDFGTHFSPRLDFRGTYEGIQISLTEERLREALRDGYMLRREVDSGGETGDLRIVVQDRATGSIGSVRVAIGAE